MSGFIREISMSTFSFLEWYDTDLERAEMADYLSEKRFYKKRERIWQPCREFYSPL
jgi:hypothetical protein